MNNHIFLVDEAAMLAFGASWATHITAPCIINLVGDLGVGKTTFARGLLQGLGYTGTVQSPTYPVVRSYSLPQIELHHFDLYRFTSPEEWEDAGLDDLLSNDSIALIEWAQHGGNYVPPFDLTFYFVYKNSGRVCTITANSITGNRSLASWHN